MSDKAPWNTNPATIEQMLEAVDAQHAWEAINGKPAPILWCPMLSSRMFRDVITRILELEKKVGK